MNKCRIRNAKTLITAFNRINTTYKEPMIYPITSSAITMATFSLWKISCVRGKS